MNRWGINYPDYLMHHGIKGQKWGVRRFQNEDGSYTEEGLLRRNQYKDAYKKTESVHNAFSRFWRRDLNDWRSRDFKDADIRKNFEGDDEAYEWARYNTKKERNKKHTIQGAISLGSAIVPGIITGGAVALTNPITYGITGPIALGAGTVTGILALYGGDRLITGIAGNVNLERERRTNDHLLTTKTPQHSIADPERLKDKYGVSLKDANKRIDKINKNKKVIKRS